MNKSKFPPYLNFVSIVFFLVLFFHFLLFTPSAFAFFFIGDEESKNYYYYLEKLENLSSLLEKATKKNNFEHSKQTFLLTQKNLLKNLYLQLRENPFESEEQSQLIYKKISHYEDLLKSFLNFQQ